MRVINEPSEFMQIRMSAIALGYFDGLHIGHKAVINAMLQSAKINNTVSIVHTFDRHPLHKSDNPKQLLSFSEKVRILSDLGVDYLYVQAFDNTFANMECIDFIKHHLLDIFKAKDVFAGYNYTFGRGGAGNTDTLRELCAGLGINTHIIPPVTLNGQAVSSTIIRSLIENKEFSKAQNLMS